MRRLLKRFFLRDPFEREVRRWFRDKGDTTLRLAYPLNKTSVIFDVGGFQGDFAAEIVERFDCHVFVFEPHPEYFQQISNRFQTSQKVKVFNFGISDADGEFLLQDAADGSSFDNQTLSGPGIKCRLRKFSSVIDELDIDHIDLMKINIEGGEFPLLQHVLDHGLENRITYFQIQFHNFIDGAEGMRDDIRTRLSKTHDCTWCYEFVWENWTRK